MAASKLDEHRDLITALFAEGRNPRHVGERLGVDAETVRRWARRNHIEVPAPAAAVVAPVVQVEEVSKEDILNQEVTELRAALRRDRKVEVAHERVMLAIETALERQPLHHLKAPAAKPAPKGAYHRQAVILSDWHAGEVVDPVQVGGLNDFNWDVLEERVDSLVDGLLSFRDVRPALTGLDLWVLGDMVSGDIHEELTATNQFPIAEQAVKTGKLIASVVARLAPHYPDLHISCVSGNHARTKAPHASKQVFDSWDWTAYQLAEGLTSPLKNVKWEIPRAGSLVRDIAGLRFLLFHGDGIRSSMPGVPAGGVSRRTNELRKQYAQQGIHLDGFACGHFHSANMWAGNVFINGSLIGTNEYGLKNFGGGEAPKQLLLTFDERKHRITDVGFLTPTAGLGLAAALAA